jgi:quinol monooxygenase YgiN
MYGTIFKLDIKPGHHEALLEALREHNTPKGMTAWFVMNPDEENEWVAVSVFESKEAYVANADSPEQHEMFLRVMEHLETEPKWTDGTYVIGEIS